MPEPTPPSPSPRPVVLVTGGARRIGRAIALELGGHGFDVAVHFHTSAADADATVGELRGLGAQAAAFGADLSDDDACCALVPAVVERFGRISAVVHNASAFVHDDVWTFSNASLEAHLRANASPAIFLGRTLHAHLAAAGAAPRSGCLVNLLDQKLWNLNPDHVAYTLSKSALQTATVMLAQALAPLLRVCGVAPGVSLPSGPMSDAEFAQAHRLTPLERSSTPDDVARAVRFLVESPAITGTTLLVDGGQHLAGQPRDVLFLARND